MRSVMAPRLADAYLVSERIVAEPDRREGVARRWSVSHRTMGGRWLVIQLSDNPGRWGAKGELVCSCGSDECLHRRAVRELLEPTLLPPAAA